MSGPITRASVGFWRNPAKTLSKSRSLLACSTWSEAEGRPLLARGRTVREGPSLVGLSRTAIVAAVGVNSRINSSHFGATSTFKLTTPVMLPLGLFGLATSPALDRINRYLEHDRNCRGCCFRRQCRRRAAARHNHLNQFGRELRQPIVVVLCPAIFDRHVLEGVEAGQLTGRSDPAAQDANGRLMQVNTASTSAGIFSILPAEKRT